MVYSSFYFFPATVTFPVPDITLTHDTSFCIIQFSLVHAIQFSSLKPQDLSLSVRCCVTPRDAQMNEAQPLPLSSELGWNWLG